MIRSLLFLGLGLGLYGQGLLTVPEQSQYRRTSTVHEVKVFMDLLQQTFPDLQPYQPREAPARTEMGQPLRAWRIKATRRDSVRVYINANIHAGEVEGKEAVQMLVREWLQGKHPQLRESIDLVIMPCYNAEGTDLLDPRNRVHQPNPESGVGIRENAQGLDLNRDLMKVETTNTRWILSMFQAFNPHVVMDLHTTNGSYHGFYLTYAPALAPGFEPLMTLNREILLDVRKELYRKNFPVFDYGNFSYESRDMSKLTEANDPPFISSPKSWETFDWRPRFLTNYPSLRGRLSILSEAYVYRTFQERVLETKSFVLECLKVIRQRASFIRTITAQAEKEHPTLLPLSATPKLTERFVFDVIEPIRDSQGKLIGEKNRRQVELPALTSYQYSDWVPLPSGYLIYGDHLEDIKKRLSAHSIPYKKAVREHYSALHFSFIEKERKESPRPFQGIKTLSLVGEWVLQDKSLWPKDKLRNAIYVPLIQGKARLAFYLLDPRSPDGFVYWRLMESKDILAIAPKNGQPLTGPSSQSNFEGQE
jgi:hypothetical protein